MDQDPQHVVSIYSRKYVRNVYNAIKQFHGGQAIFTFPSTPIKCPGAPQKIMYLADDILLQVSTEFLILLTENLFLCRIMFDRRVRLCIIQHYPLYSA